MRRTSCQSPARNPLRKGRGWVAVLGMLALGSCGPETSQGAADTISAEAFVEAVTALRTSELLDSSGYLPEGEPERILAEHGLVADDLRRFVEAHGEDVPMMAAIWEEIELRVNEIRNLNRS